MSHVSDSVGTERTGSTKAVETSGNRSMSLSLMAWNPRMDDPSNPSPSRIIVSSSVAAGMEKCCQVPGRSQNFTSTTWMCFCLMSSRTFWTSLLGETRTGALGRAVVAIGFSVIGVQGKEDAPASEDRTQGHRVSTVYSDQGPGGSIGGMRRFRWTADGMAAGAVETEVSERMVLRGEDG